MQSLATADLGVGIVTAFAIHPSLVGYWPYGDLACRILGGFWTTFCGVSVLSLVSISIERFLAIAFPLRYHTLVTVRRCIIVIGLLWVVNISLSVFFVTRTDPAFYSYSSGAFMCLPGCLGDDCSMHLSPGSAIYVIIPCLILPCIYISIMFVARKHRRKISGRESSISQGPSTGTTRGNADTSTRVEGRVRRNFRAAKITCVVTGVFYLSWLPLATRTFISISGVDVSPQAEFITTWLAFANSLWNFIIYTVMSKCFRSTIARGFVRVCKRKTYVEEFSY
ncbi:probable G-protein coupled receptor 21 [Ptychodera flava]|uniref:probable G-protein coupled receptor 21 n=1 Tax=Ptychodera flava TaxID=63121 RepID=UPI00396A6F15